MWSYYRDRVNNDANENNSANNYRQNNNKKTASKFFEYKTKLIGNTTADNNTLEIKFLVSLKYFNNFWRYPNLPLIYCEIKLDWSCLRKWIISQIHRTPEILANSPGNPATDCVPQTLTSDAVF